MSETISGQSNKKPVNVISKGEMRKQLEPISDMMERITIVGIDNLTNERFEIKVNAFQATKHNMHLARYQRQEDKLVMIQDAGGNDYEHKVGKNMIQGIAVPDLITGKRNAYYCVDGNPCDVSMRNLEPRKKTKITPWRKR